MNKHFNLPWPDAHEIWYELRQLQWRSKNVDSKSPESNAINIEMAHKYMEFTAEQREWIKKNYKKIDPVMVQMFELFEELDRIEKMPDEESKS